MKKNSFLVVIGTALAILPRPVGATPTQLNLEDCKALVELQGQMEELREQYGHVVKTPARREAFCYWQMTARDAYYQDLYGIKALGWNVRDDEALMAYPRTLLRGLTAHMRDVQFLCDECARPYLGEAAKLRLARQLHRLFEQGVEPAANLLVLNHCRHEELSWFFEGIRSESSRGLFYMSNLETAQRKRDEAASCNRIDNTGSWATGGEDRYVCTEPFDKENWFFNVQDPYQATTDAYTQSLLFQDYLHGVTTDTEIGAFRNRAPY